MHSLRTIRLVLAMFLLPVAAAAAEPQGEQVTVSVIAILARKGDTKVEERLKCIAEEIQKAVPPLRDCGFQLGRMTKKSVAVGASEKFDLVDDEKVDVAVVATANRDNLLQIRVKPPQMNEVTYETSCGRFLPIVTKYRTKKDEVLILAVRVQPCKK